MTRNKIRELERVPSNAELYYQLSQRQENIARNLEERLDIMAKFTKDESQAYLQHRQDRGGVYETQLVKYTRDTHKKRMHGQKNAKNTPYLIYADKVVSTLLH